MCYTYTFTNYSLLLPEPDLDTRYPDHSVTRNPHRDELNPRSVCFAESVLSL